MQEFKDYYISRETEITKHFSIASESADEYSIHELRVEIKKIRAFLELIKGITPYFDLRKAYQPIKKLFKAAAPIRDAQVLQTMTREYISEVGLDVNLSEYFNLLKQKEMAGKREFFKFCKKFNLSVLRKNWSAVESALASIAKYGDSLKSDQDKISQYLKDYLKTLFDLLDSFRNKSVLEEKYFHDIRILCKKSRYTMEILSNLFPPESFELMNKNLKLIHQPLGHWHDTDSAITLLNQVLADKTIKPLFSESSYNDTLQSFQVRKQHFNDLFADRFKTLNLKEIF